MLREGGELVRGHTARTCCVQDSDPDLSISNQGASMDQYTLPLVFLSGRGRVNIFTRVHVFFLKDPKLVTKNQFDIIFFKD